MKADEIRAKQMDCGGDLLRLLATANELLQEIAAQLAEANELCRQAAFSRSMDSVIHPAQRRN